MSSYPVRSHIHSMMVKIFYLFVILVLSANKCQAYYLSLRNYLNPGQNDYKELQKVSPRFEETITESDIKKFPSEIYTILESMTKYGKDDPPYNWALGSCSSQTLDRIITTSSNVSTVAHTCSDFPVMLFPKWIRETTVFGKCPSKKRRRELPLGSFPPHMSEVTCPCEGQQCSNRKGICYSVMQLMPIWIPKCDQTFTTEYTLSTVDCLCVQRPARLANMVISPALEN